MAFAYKFSTRKVILPKHDCDVEIVFPGGKTLTIQARPSNADVDYNGSLDIILPENQAVTNWSGDDMTPARPVKKQSHTRIAKQLVTDLPGNYQLTGTWSVVPKRVVQRSPNVSSNTPRKA